MYKKKSFTLIELAIVIVIISVILSTILVSKVLIEYAKVVKIQEEARMISLSINLFRDQYDCLPGDCVVKQISNLVSSGLNSTCTINTGTAVGYTVTPLGTGSIETVVKRTCMMHELKLAGNPFFSTVDSTYTTLTDSIAGKNIPFAKFSNKAAWDVRVASSAGPGLPCSSNTCIPYIPYTGSDSNSGYMGLPFELGMYSPNIFANNNYALLRNANMVAGSTGDISFIVNDNITAYAISANLSRKIDVKFDDGMPYTGNIIGGLALTDIYTLISGGVSNSCNTLSTSQLASSYPISQALLGPIQSNNYISSNSVNRGCLMVFLIDRKI